MKPEYPPELSWLPDWTDPNQYPPAKGTTGSQWAWEFLRRNPGYQQAYLRLMEKLPTNPPLAPPLLTEEGINMCWSIIQRFHLMDGLFPPDPRSNHISDSCFKANWFRYFRLDKDQSIPKQGPWDTKILIEFDLSLPVDPQLKHARQILRREGKGTARYKVQNLSDYLRILDAKTALPQPTLPQIAQTVFPKLAGKVVRKDDPLVERVKESYKVARKLRDFDYWKLVPLA